MITIQSVINVVTDFYVLLLPIPRLVKLQVSRRRQIGLLLTFLSGLGFVFQGVLLLQSIQYITDWYHHLQCLRDQFGSADQLSAQ